MAEQKQQQPQLAPLSWRQALSSPQPYRPGPLTPAQVQAFWRDGFTTVAVPDGLDMNALRQTVGDLVDANARRLVAKGRLAADQLHIDQPLATRQALIEADAPGSSWNLFIRDCNGPDSTFARSPAGRALQSNPGLADIAAQLTGSNELALSASFSLRVKCPNAAQTDQLGASGGTFHQDTAYLLPEAEDTVAVTFWLPLQATTSRMGAMQYEVGGHARAYAQHNGRTLPHHVGWGNGDINPTAYMELDNMPEQGRLQTVEVPHDHLIVTSNIIPHRGTENLSDEMRWSIDLRLQDSRMPGGAPSYVVRKGGDPAWRPDFSELRPGPRWRQARKHPWSQQKVDMHKRQAELQRERRQQLLRETGPRAARL